MTTETTDTGAVGPGRGGRMSRPRKREAVLRLLRGEDLETVSRVARGDGGGADRAGVTPSWPRARRRSRPARPTARRSRASG